MQYFTIHELCRSHRAAQLGIDNSPNYEQAQNLTALITAVLDPARARWGRPITVTSGFRCPELNSRTPNASRNSQHTKGEAADIIASRTNRQANFDLGRLIASLGNFDQLIFEDTGRTDLLPEWIHVSWKRTGINRHEIRKHVKGTGPIYPLIDKKLLNL